MHSDVCGLLQKCFGPSQTSTDVVAESTPSHKIAGVTLAPITQPKLAQPCSIALTL